MKTNNNTLNFIYKNIPQYFTPRVEYTMQDKYIIVTLTYYQMHCANVEEHDSTTGKKVRRHVFMPRFIKYETPILRINAQTTDDAEKLISAYLDIWIKSGEESPKGFKLVDHGIQSTLFTKNLFDNNYIYDLQEACKRLKQEEPLLQQVKTHNFTVDENGNFVKYKYTHSVF